MTGQVRLEPTGEASMEIYVRGQIHDVGFRATVWQYAQALRLAGDVRNDGEGVLIRARGTLAAINTLLNHLKLTPPLAALDTIERYSFSGDGRTVFAFGRASWARPHINKPDARLCPACAQPRLRIPGGASLRAFRQGSSGHDEPVAELAYGDSPPRNFRITHSEFFQSNLD